jgi:hypothetical protein
MKSVDELISEIRQRIDNIEGMLAWVVTSRDRAFRVGQRVEYSRRANRRGLVPKTRTNIRGTIKTFPSVFTVRVLFDDRKHPRDLHHSFLNPISGPKLF